MAVNDNAARRGIWNDAFTLARYGLAVVLLLHLESWPMLWRQLSFMIGLAIVTYPVRAVRWGMIYNFFLIGIVWTWLIIGAEYLIEWVIMRDGAATFRHAVVAPVIEEPLKLVPLILVMLVGRWRFRHSYGASDLMNLGGAIGAGVAYFETLLVGRPFRGTSYSPTLFGYDIIPDALSGYLGHAGSTAMISLAIGGFLYAVRWRKLVVAGAVLVVLIAAWMIIDHGMHNYQVDGTGRVYETALMLWRFDGQGRFAPYFFVIAVLLTVAIERYVLWRMLRGFPRRGIRRAFSSVIAPLRRSVGYREARESLMRMKALFLYVLAVRQIGYLRAHSCGDRAVDRKAIAEAVVRRVAELVASLRSGGLIAQRPASGPGASRTSA